MHSITDKIIVQKDGAIGRITFNNPERRNAISFEMGQEMRDAAGVCKTDEAMRVVVLSGADDKS